MKTQRMHGPFEGLTLLEVIFASAIMSTIAVMVFLILHRSTDTYSNQSMHLALDERGREILAEIARDLREGGRDTFSSGTPPVAIVEGQPYGDLRFGVNSGYDMTGRRILFTRVVRYRFVLDAGESANGMDDDGDGLADEGFVERTDRHGRTTRLCGDVRSPGLAFVVTDRLVKVTLVLERRDPKGTLIRRDAVTSVELRN